MVEQQPPAVGILLPPGKHVCSGALANVRLASLEGLGNWRWLGGEIRLVKGKNWLRADAPSAELARENLRAAIGPNSRSGKNPFGGQSHGEILRCFDRWMRCCACRKAPTFASWIAVILLTAGGSVALAPNAARAAPVLFGVQGVFEDGGTFSGTFLFDPLQPPSPPPGPPTAFIDAFSLTSTPGPVFPGFAYSGVKGRGWRMRTQLAGEPGLARQ
jgi:hypothetical protein